MRKLVVLLVLFCTFAVEAQQFVFTHRVKIENERVVEKTPCDCGVKVIGNLVIISDGDKEIYLVERDNSFVREEDDFVVFKFNLQTKQGVYQDITTHIVKDFRGIVILDKQEKNGLGYINLNKEQR